MNISGGRTGEGRVRGDSQGDGSDGNGGGVKDSTARGSSGEEQSNGQATSGYWSGRSTCEITTIGRKFSSGMMSLGSFDDISERA